LGLGRVLPRHPDRSYTDTYGSTYCDIYTILDADAFTDVYTLGDTVSYADTHVYTNANFHAYFYPHGSPDRHDAPSNPNRLVRITAIWFLWILFVVAFD
jgi:hypothetical protein